MNGEREFTLPYGLEVGDKVFRSGRMRPATALDEIETQESSGIQFNGRLRDINLLSRVVTSIGEISPVTEEHIEELYEADFIYLQLLCSEMDRSDGRVAVRCPRCGKEHHFDPFRLFEEKGDKQ